MVITFLKVYGMVVLILSIWSGLVFFGKELRWFYVMKSREPNLTERLFLLTVSIIGGLYVSILWPTIFFRKNLP